MIKPTLTIIFYKSESGREPVIDWLEKLDSHERLKIGEDLQTLQYRWPLGMPLVRSLGKGLWELRTKLPTRISRIIFVVQGGYIILLHGFIKKTEKTPPREIAIAQERLKKLGGYGYA
jgi:phage-related protein